jgi:hypothetical protein
MDEVELISEIARAAGARTENPKRFRRLLDKAISHGVLQSEEDFGEGWRLEDPAGQNILPEAMRGLAFAESILAWHFWDAVGRPDDTRLLFFECLEDIRYYTTPPEVEEAQ